MESTIWKKTSFWYKLVGCTYDEFIEHLNDNKWFDLLEGLGYTGTVVKLNGSNNDPKYFSKCFKKESGKNPIRIKGRIDGIEVSDL